MHGDVGTRFLQAFGHGAYARTQLQPGIPAATDELAHSFALRFGRVLWQQHQHIHIRVRTQLRPAIPSYGHQATWRWTATGLCAGKAQLMFKGPLEWLGDFPSAGWHLTAAQLRKYAAKGRPLQKTAGWQLHAP